MKYPESRDRVLLRAVLVAATAFVGVAGCDDPPRCRGDACLDAGDPGTDAGDAGGALDGGHAGGHDAGQDAGPVVACANLPPGLYVPGSCSTLAANVFRF